MRYKNQLISIVIIILLIVSINKNDIMFYTQNIKNETATPKFISLLRQYNSIDEINQILTIAANTEKNFISHAEIIIPKNKKIMIYKTLIDFEKVYKDKNLLSNNDKRRNLLKNEVIKTQCSLYGKNYLIQKKDVKIRYEYIDIKSELKDIILIDKDDCKEWNGEHYIFNFIKNKYLGMESL